MAEVGEYIHIKQWYTITYSFPKPYAIQVAAWIVTFAENMNVIIYPCPHFSSSMLLEYDSVRFSFPIISIYVPEWADHTWKICMTLTWRHNGRDGVSNQQPNDCLLNRLFRCRSKKISKLRVTGLCAGNSPVTGEFPAQMASNAENVSIWWRHHDIKWNEHWLFYYRALVQTHLSCSSHLIWKEITRTIFEHHWIATSTSFRFNIYSTKCS